MSIININTALGKLKAETIEAEGPEGLAAVLNHLWELSKQDPEFAVRDHCIMYKQGDQKSLMMFYMNGEKPEILFCDILKRPATSTVINITDAFLREKCGLKDPLNQFRDLYDRKMRVAASILGVNFLLPADPIGHAYELLFSAKYGTTSNPSVGQLGLFSKGLLPSAKRQEFITDPEPYQVNPPSKGMTR